MSSIGGQSRSLLQDSHVQRSAKKFVPGSFVGVKDSVRRKTGEGKGQRQYSKRQER